MPIKPVDIKNAVINEDDFGFEMRVASLINDRALKWTKNTFNSTDISEIVHGGTYEDAVTGKPRQFDFRCKITKSEGVNAQPGAKGKVFTVQLAIECKNLNEDAPLVICGRPRTSDEAYYVFIESNYSASYNRGKPSTFKVSNDQFYEVGKFVGKSVLRLTPDKADKEKLKKITDADVYERWSQAVASALELTKEAGRVATIQSIPHRTILLPIVVVPDDSLWIVSYAENGSLEGDPVQTNECQFFIGRHQELPRGDAICSYTLTHFHFVTMTGLGHFLDRFIEHSSRWKWIFPPTADQLPFQAGKA